jgi:hypothetical protein
MREGEDGMTAHDPVGTLPGWLTLNNRHTGECLQLRRVDLDGEMCLEWKGTLLVGTLLGRYKGTDWPGSPDRFPSAPRFTEPIDRRP